MIRRVLLSVCLGVGLASSASAQLATQTALVGTVSDTSKGVLPGATVVAVNAGTRDTYETTTNDQGYYNIQFVRPGQYEITISLGAFQSVKVTGVEVATNQIVRRDTVLQVGGMSETVTVQAAAAMLATDSATIAERINERAVQELPVSGRNVWSLAGTTPGVLAGTSSFTGAGQRNIQNSLSMDGINTAANLLTSTSMRPISDAVTEVQVQTGSTSAEYGSYLGVHVNIVTKSGTNEPHGSLFEYFQDDALDNRGYFENRANPKNPRKRNQGGAQADGPLMIPGLYNGRNRTFFMGAYEGVRAEALSSQFVTVPTALMRQGNFSEVSAIVRDPVTKVPYPGNIIPASQLSPIAIKLLQYYPATNRTGTANNVQADAANTDNIDQVLARVDQNIGNKVRLYGRYNWYDSYNANIGAIPITGITQPRVNKNTLFSYTHTLKPNLYNDFRIGYHRLDFDTLNQFSVNGVASAGSDLGIPGFNGDVKFKNPGLPSINISNFSGLSTGGTNWYQFDTTFQMSNVAAYNREAHNVRFGFDLRRLTTGRRAANDPRGRFDFTGDISGYSVA